jgi:hypothetical protein
LYTIEPTGLQEVDSWLERFRALWTPRLEALAKEVARGKAERTRHGTKPV